MAIQQSTQLSCPQDIRIHSYADFYEATKAAANVGFGISAKWEQDPNTAFDVATATTALGECPVYRIAEADYRGPDAEAVDEDSDEGFALRLFATRCFAAGLAAARAGS